MPGRRCTTPPTSASPPLPRHLFAIANVAYSKVMDAKHNQCIIIRWDMAVPRRDSPGWPLISGALIASCQDAAASLARPRGPMSASAGGVLGAFGTGAPPGRPLGW